MDQSNLPQSDRECARRIRNKIQDGDITRPFGPIPEEGTLAKKVPEAIKEQ